MIVIQIAGLDFTGRQKAEVLLVDPPQRHVGFVEL